MNKDKKILYCISCISLAILLIALLTVKTQAKFIIAGLMVLIAAAVLLFLKKRSVSEIAKKEVLLVMSVVAVLVMIAIELSGEYFGYYKNPYFVNQNIIFFQVLPLAVIIVAEELIRNVLLAQKSRFAGVIAFILCMLADVLAFSGIVGMENFNQFMNLFGMTLFPAITANLFYHYISKRYGAMPNIVYRLILALYSYFLPQTSAMGDAIAACIKILLPILMYVFIHALFSKKKKNAKRKREKLSWIGTALAVAIITSVALLISCQFRFGAIVIATESMTGEINKGDMILYEKYDNQTIGEGQVIVFMQNENKIVHRVVKIEHMENEIRYYTKGDANEDLDEGYRTKDDIFAITDVKLSFVGYPTLWLRELLDGSN